MNNSKDNAEKEIWSDKRLKSELAHCGLPVGRSAFTFTIVGIIGYPFLVNRFLTNYIGYELRFLVASCCVLVTTFGTGYLAGRICEENIQKKFEEGRREALEKQKQISK